VPPRAQRLLLSVILALAVVLRFWGLRFGLPNDYARPDEEKIVRPALAVVGGDPNPHLFLYPSLFTYVTAGACAVTFAAERVAGMTESLPAFLTESAVDPSIAITLARALSALAGAATVGVLYAAARQWFSQRAALVAAAICAVTFLHVRDSHFGVTDVPAAFLTVCAFWAALRCEVRGLTWKRVALTGLLCGLAASTKYNAGLVVLPAALSVVLARSNDARDWRRLAQFLALLGATAVLGFLAGTPYALLDAGNFLAGVGEQRQVAMGEYHTTILDGARRVIGERGWIHHLTFSLRYGVGLPVLAAAAAGAVWFAAVQPRRAAILLSFPIAFYAAMGASLLVYARWMTPIVPFICLAAAICIDRLAEMIGTVVADRRAPAAAAILLTVLISSTTAARAVAFDRVLSRTDTRVLGAEWIEKNFPAGARVYQTGRAYGYLEPRPASRYSMLWFDDRWGVFSVRHGAAPETPDLIVVLESPLGLYSGVPTRLPAVLANDYELTATFTGLAPLGSGNAIYDQQDAFYVPFAGLDAVRRPGPTVRIFQRKVR
jgi:hypothetical protein